MVKVVDPVWVSVQDVVLESGKLLKVFWKDKTINGLLRRVPKDG